MDKIKEELRLVIAFALAVIIIMLFGRTQVRPTPESKPPAETPAAVQEEQKPPDEKPAVLTSLPEPPPAGEEKTYETGRYIIKIDTAGGMIKDIGLKEYTRKGETSLAVFEDSDLLLDHTANSTPSSPAMYTVEKTDNLIKLQTAAKNTVTEKTIEIPEDSYTFKSGIKIHNTGKEVFNLKDYTVSAGRIAIQAKNKGERELTPPEIIINAGGRTVKHNATRIKEAALYDDTSWIAVKQRYGLVFIRTETAAKSFVSAENSMVKIGFAYDNVTVAPGATEELKFSFYAGPSDYFVAGKEIPDKSIFGTGFFTAMGRILFTGLSYIHKVIPNWGWAIILLTIVIKIIFFPLTQKSLKSMKAMQKLRPYLQDVQKKYKGNPQQMQKELMNLYKEYKINPFGGCLPMLIQFPIFIGFFIALRNSVFLRGASFGLWITDLSQPDTITRIGDFNVNLLPVIMAATSFWQQKLTPQEPSQKALVYMMPVMFLFLFYNFSSGLLLYWITMNMAGLVEQYFVHKK